MNMTKIDQVVYLLDQTTIETILLFFEGDGEKDLLLRNLYDRIGAVCAINFTGGISPCLSVNPKDTRFFSQGTVSWLPIPQDVFRAELYAETRYPFLQFDPMKVCRLNGYGTIVKRGEKWQGTL